MEYRGRDEESDQVNRERTSPRKEVVREASKEVEELARSGNFANWSTATVKVDTDSSMASTSSKVISSSVQQKSVNDKVDMLHRKVASKVEKNSKEGELEKGAQGGVED